MRLLVDLLACQTKTCSKDAGRFALSLARAIAVQRGNNQMYALADILYPEAFEQLRQEFIRLLPAGSFIPYYHQPVEIDPRRQAGTGIQIAAALVSQAYQVISPDVVLTLNPFEGWREKGVVPPPSKNNLAYSQVAILYELPPSVTRHQNLENTSDYEPWRLDRLRLLSGYDLLLTLSETIRQDAIKLLDIDPKKIVMIDEAVDSLSREAESPENEKQGHWENIARCAWSAMDSLRVERRVRSAIKPISSVRRERIAYLSPLPPQQSGISRYSADLLPHLARYFDIDLFVSADLKDPDPELSKNFSIFPCTRLLQEKDRYRTVVYHQGNARFHAHMFELERQFPGVVVLHDFFLSHLVANLGRPRWIFRNALDDSHGLRGVIDYRKKKMDVAWDWPINWKVLRYARQLIAHSKFQHTLMERFFGRGWTPPINVIHQPQPLPPEVTEDQRLSARKRLGIEADLFLVCTFGWITRTKMIETIIHAFKLASLSPGTDVILILVGDCRDAGYQRELSGLIHSLQLAKRIRFIGYVDEEAYKDFLIAANYSVQLRKSTRGETSKSVLDCMAYGLPTIINAHGALNDFCEEDVVKISDPVDVEELANAMNRLQNDSSLRLEKRWHARKTIADQYNPEIVAVAYAEVINRAIQTDDRRLFSPLTDVLRKSNNSFQLTKSQAKWAVRNFSNRSQPRILIDGSSVAFEDHRTGIQRVVKSIIRELFELDDPSLRIEIVRFKKGRFLRANRFTERLLGLPDRSLGPEKPIIIQPGDTLLLMDSYWRFHDRFPPTFDCIRKNGGKIITLIYDLLPIRHPECFPPGMSEIYQNYLRCVISQSDVIVCISRPITEDVNKFIVEQRISPRQRLDITYLHPGADFSVAPSMVGMDEEKRRSLASKIPCRTWKESAAWLLDVIDGNLPG